MARDLTIWDGDGLPEDEEEAASLLSKELQMTLPEIEGMVEVCKAEAWVNEKMSKSETFKKDKSWYESVSRYFWRRSDRLRRLCKVIEADLDEQNRLTDELIEKVKNPNNKRNLIAYEYGWLLQSRHYDGIGWERIHDAIIERWSPAGLSYIKNKAWDIVRKNS